ncbi:hypothetical protein RNJ44_03319 [Nakaseomyces bracarensis]|uniref:1,3-beta-glucanosyltransferase n=1 Tax=Nakaseomyces bracarensis TaxID=273131 RepID=A0ABR4NZK6_9SACH
MLAESVLLLLAASNMAQALLPIHIKDYRFIKPSSPNNTDTENEIFFVKGIDYQPGGSSAYDGNSGEDVLSDADVCARDAYVFQQLGINTIRVYTLNPDVNHDECMTILNDAGIYVILDVNSGNYGENLNRADPWGTYNAQYLSRVFKFIDAFKNYPNVLGFFSGNEVINDEKNYANIDPQYIRAVQRDMKQYIAKHSNRTIPVGYSAADNTDLRLPTLNYLQCNSLNGKNVSVALNESRADFFGLNTYEWCSGSSDWQSSGYDKLNSSFADAAIPLIFSEFGCNKNLPRTFDEVSKGLYGGLKNTFSGGLVYEYAEEANHYGLVDIDDDDNSVTYKEDFDNLKSQYESLELPTTKESDVPENNIVLCNGTQITDEFEDFGVNNFTIPTQPDDIARMIKWGVNGTNIGKLLDDYTLPKSSNYTIKDTDGNELSGEIAYNASNAINSLYTPSSSTSSSSSVSSSTSKSSSASSSSASSTKSTKTKSGGKKEKNGANFIEGPSFETGFGAVLAAVIYALI